MESAYKSLPPLAALKAFEVFGRVGGIRRAARVLNVDHAVISRHLRTLESRVGTILVERHPGERGNWLTCEGERYHRRVSAALMELANASDELNSSRQMRLHLCCSPGFALHWLGKRLRDFTSQHPELEVELRSTDARANLASNEADCDIRYVRTGQQAGMGDTPIRQFEFARPEVFPVASPDYVAGLARPITTAADLLGLTLLHEESEDEWLGWLRANQVVASTVPGMRLWQAHLCLCAAREGQGIALANPFLAAEDLEAGRLVRVTGTERPFMQVELGGYNIVAREDRWNFLAIARFRRWLLQACPQDVRAGA
jgi:DNA-binding transcriptional LysR family regulator